MELPGEWQQQPLEEKDLLIADRNYGRVRVWIEDNPSGYPITALAEADTIRRQFQETYGPRTKVTIFGGIVDDKQAYIVELSNAGLYKHLLMFAADTHVFIVTFTCMASDAPYWKPIFNRIRSSITIPMPTRRAIPVIRDANRA
jgi:hypothetical protein